MYECAEIVIFCNRIIIISLQIIVNALKLMLLITIWGIMLDSAIAMPETSYFEKASQFAWSCAKAPVNLGWACVTSTPAKATALALSSLAASAVVAVLPAVKYNDVRIMNQGFSIDSYMPDALAKIYETLFIAPVNQFTDFAENYLSVKAGSLPLSYHLYHAGGEEILYREIIQNQILPNMAKILPERAGYILAHPITRVAIASVIFATAHVSNWNLQQGVMPQLISGVIYGAAREISGGLSLPILGHTIHNLMLETL